MAGQCRMDGDICHLLIACLDDKNDIGILSHDRSENPGEGEADLWLDLNLVNIVQLKLDRVFDSQNILLLCWQAQQRSVECGRLAAACRSGNQKNPIGTVQDASQLPIDSLAKTEVFQRFWSGTPIKDAHNDPLAMQGRYD